MFSEDQIQHQFGGKVLNYVKNKHQGDTNRGRVTSTKTFSLFFSSATSLFIKIEAFGEPLEWSEIVPADLDESFCLRSQQIQLEPEPDLANGLLGCQY